MLDGTDLSPFKAAPPAQLEENGGGGRLLLGAPHFLFRQDDVDAGLTHGGKGGNRSGKFPFKGANLIDFLEEAGGPEGLLAVEKLITDGSAAGQSLPGEGHPDAADFGGRDGDLRAVGADGVRGLELVKFGNDGPGIAGGEVAVEDSHCSRRQPGGKEQEKGDERDAYAAHEGESRGAKIAQGAQEIVHG